MTYQSSTNKPKENKIKKVETVSPTKQVVLDTYAKLKKQCSFIRDNELKAVKPEQDQPLYNDCIEETVSHLLVEDVCKALVADLCSKDYKAPKPEEIDIAATVKRLIKGNLQLRNELKWSWVCDWEVLWERFLTTKMLGSGLVNVITDFHDCTPELPCLYANMWGYRYAFSGSKSLSQAMLKQGLDAPGAPSQLSATPSVSKLPQMDIFISESVSQTTSTCLTSPHVITTNLMSQQSLKSSQIPKGFFLLYGSDCQRQPVIMQGEDPGYLLGLAMCPIPRNLVDYDEELIGNDPLTKDDIYKVFGELQDLQELIKEDSVQSTLREKMKELSKQKQSDKKIQQDLYEMTIKDALSKLSLLSENAKKLVSKYIRNNLITALVVAESGRNREYFKAMYKELNQAEGIAAGGLLKYLRVARDYMQYRDVLSQYDYNIDQCKDLLKTLKDEGLKQRCEDAISSIREKKYTTMLVDLVKDELRHRIQERTSSLLENKEKGPELEFCKRCVSKVIAIFANYIANFIKQSLPDKDYKGITALLLTSIPKINALLSSAEMQDATLSIIKEALNQDVLRRNHVVLYMEKFENTKVKVDQVLEVVSGPDVAKQLVVLGKLISINDGTAIKDYRELINNFDILLSPQQDAQACYNFDLMVVKKISSIESSEMLDERNQNNKASKELEQDIFRILNKQDERLLACAQEKIGFTVRYGQTGNLNMEDARNLAILANEHRQKLTKAVKEGDKSEETANKLGELRKQINELTNKIAINTPGMVFGKSSYVLKGYGDRHDSDSEQEEQYENLREVKKWPITSW